MMTLTGRWEFITMLSLPSCMFLNSRDGEYVCGGVGVGVPVAYKTFLTAIKIQTFHFPPHQLFFSFLVGSIL